MTLSADKGEKKKDSNGYFTFLRRKHLPNLKLYMIANDFFTGKYEF